MSLSRELAGTGVSMKVIAIGYASLLMFLGIWSWLATYAGQPMAGKLLGAMLLFYLTCLLADQISQQPQAEVLIRLGCCVVLTILFWVMGALSNSQLLA